jgi:hypothetical protein
MGSTLLLDVADMTATLGSGVASIDHNVTDLADTLEAKELRKWAYFC